MRLLSLVAGLALLFPMSARADCACEACLGLGATAPVVAVDARRSLEIARLEQRLYRRVEHPSRVRQLYTAIEFSEARIESLRRLLVEYDRITRFGTGSALSVTAANARLDLMREEAHLRDLREQLVLERRHYRDMKRVHAEQVRHAAAVLAAQASPAGEPRITIVNH